MVRPRKNNRRRTGDHISRSAEDVFWHDAVEKPDMHNERLEAYYKAQHIVPDNEWEELLETLRQPLPTTFRLAGNRQLAHELNGTIRDTYVPSLTNVVFEGIAISPPKQLSWYPGGLAWQFNVPKNALRKSLEFRKFHSFLVFETEVGNISRQEAVSMLPPLFLDVEPHHFVMDMCAAPGSKTAQILEALHAHDTATATSMPPGLLIANDSDNKRTHLLIHQSARIPSPALMVTNLDASIYPIIKVPVSQNQNIRGGKKKSEQLLFDRILCDVPCSGDGTMRKNIGIWKNWQPMDGNGLHSLQLRILQRAMKMLKEDGRIVYSTCSMNPVENEAVIAAAIKSNPNFEIVDVSERLPGLKRRPGIAIWRPTVDKSINTTFDTYDTFLKSLPGGEPNTVETKMTEGHWPPPDAEYLGLERCLRIYPHLQDTGAFFIAVLQRKQKLMVNAAGGGVGGSKGHKRDADDAVKPDETKRPKLDVTRHEMDHPSMPEGDEIVKMDLDDPGDEACEGDAMPTSEPSKGKNRSTNLRSRPTSGFKENPYTYVLEDDPVLLSCIQSLNLTSDFPSRNILVRNPEGDPVRTLYLTNDIVKRVVQNNDYTRIRLTACGTKVFTKQEGRKNVEAQFRVLGEGLPAILPYTDPSSIMPADIPTLKTLLEIHYPLFGSFALPFRSDIEKRAPGSHIVKFSRGDWNGATITHDLFLPVWKSNLSVTLMIDKRAKSALSLRLFGEDISAAGRTAEKDERKGSAVTAESSGAGPR